MRRSIILGGAAAIIAGAAGAVAIYTMPQPELPRGNPPRGRPAGREIVLAVAGMH